MDKFFEMKIQEQFSVHSGGKDYTKFVAVIPNKAVKASNLKSGDIVMVTVRRINGKVAV